MDFIFGLLNEFVKPLLEALAGHYGKFAEVVAHLVVVMGLARVIFKPVMLALHSISEATDSKKDDELLEKVEASKGFKIFSFVMDYILSIKLPEKK
jgi:hypothetical protein